MWLLPQGRTFPSPKKVPQVSSLYNPFPTLTHSLWLGYLGAPHNGIRSTTGLCDMLPECDTCRPTEDSKYIFYDPGKLSPVTFRRKEDGRSRGTSRVSVIWILLEQKGILLPFSGGSLGQGLQVGQISGVAVYGGGSPLLLEPWVL